MNGSVQPEGSQVHDLHASSFHLPFGSAFWASQDGASCEKLTLAVDRETNHLDDRQELSPLLCFWQHNAAV